MEDNKSFSYTYSAENQSEIERIRSKYVPKETDKMEQLRALDRRVTRKASSRALSYGIFGALVLGIGMCCTMVWKGALFFPGIVIGLAGIGAVASAYPAYNRKLKKERERIAPEILRLTDELLK